MPPKHRVLWYIYTRNLLQKGGAYTQFASKDYPLFASILECKPHDVGHWLFQEISRFRFQSRKISKIPFPTLVSLILFDHKIWYLTNEGQVAPPIFGISQLNQMQLHLEGIGQSQEPSASKVASTSKIPQKSKGKAKVLDEVQSEQQFPDIEKALDKLTSRIEIEMSKVLAQVYEKHNILVDDYTKLKEQMDRIEKEQAEQRSAMSTLLVTMMDLSDKFSSFVKSKEASTSKDGEETRTEDAKVNGEDSKSPKVVEVSEEESPEFQNTTSEFQTPPTSPDNPLAIIPYIPPAP